MKCKRCHNPLEGFDLAFAEAVDNPLCGSCLNGTQVISEEQLTKIRESLNRRRFHCSGCNTDVKLRYQDVNRPSYCTRCTGTSSQIPYYPLPIHTWPTSVLNGENTSPAPLTEEIQKRQEELDRTRYTRAEETVAVDPEEWAALLEKLNKVEMQQANSRNKQVSKRMWNR